jgi:hypothetical protein
MDDRAFLGSVQETRGEARKENDTVKIGKWLKAVGAIAAISVLGLAVLSIGCGGSDDNGGGGGGGKSVDTPEEYAAAVCDALAGRIGEMEALFSGETAFEDPSQLKDAIDKVQPAVDQLAKDLDKINPPSDVKDWHDSSVEAMTQAADLFDKLGKILDKPLDEAMAEMEDLMPQLEGMQEPFGMEDLPQEYQDAFESDPKCQELDIFSQATPEA